MTTQAPAMRKETDNLGALLDSLLAWAQAHDDNISFVGATGGAVGVTAALTVEVQDANNILEPFTLAGQVTVDITGGTASDKLVSADGRSHATTLIIAIVDGVGSFEISSAGTSSQTVILGLTDHAATGLNVADTHTYTYA